LTFANNNTTAQIEGRVKMYVVQNQGCMQIGYKGFQFLALDIFDNKIKTLNPTLGGVSTHATLPNTENAIKTKKIL
jgi:hypothetical protein